MMIVEQYPTLTWGTDLYVEPNENGLIVTGLEPMTREELGGAPDVFRAYREAAASRRKGWDKLQASHIELANANDDEKLTQFVQHFGPVVVSSLRREDIPMPPDPDALSGFERSRSLRIAQQDWTELRNEQQMFRAALTLVAELERGKETNLQTVRDCIVTIFEKANQWPGQWHREQQLRMSGLGFDQQATWLFEEDSLRRLAQEGSMGVTPRPTLGERIAKKPIKPTLHRGDVIHAGHLVICELANAFPPRVYPWGETAIEGPHCDLSFGIRPVLYYMLRREYLSKSGVAVCLNSDCRELFEIERAEQHYCSAECSRRQRQRKYWEDQGKELRQKRRHKISKSGNVGQAVNKGEIKQPKARR